MTFIVYHTTSLHIYKTCTTLAGAKRSATALNKKAVRRAAQFGNELNGTYAATDRANFDANIDHFVTRKNLLSGQEFQIKASEAGGCCDPSTELYHSM